MYIYTIFVIVRFHFTKYMKNVIYTFCGRFRVSMLIVEAIIIICK